MEMKYQSIRRRRHLWNAIHLAPIVIVPLIFCPWSFDSFELPKLLILRLFLTLALIEWTYAPDARRPYRMSLLHLPVVLFVGAFLLATVFSSLPRLSFTGSYQSYAGLMRILDGAIIYLLASQTMRRPLIRRAVLRAILISAAAAASYGIVQFMGGDFGKWDLSEEAGTSALRRRCFSTMGSPSFLGLFLAACVPLAMANISGTRRDWRLQTPVLILIATCLVLTFSRAAWIGATVGILVFLSCVAPKSRLRKHAVAVFALSIGIGIGIGMTSSGGHKSAADRFASLWGTPTGSVSVRFRLWRGSRAMFAAKPLLGWGPGTFRYVFPRFAPPEMKETERYNVSSHNSLLDTALQAGVIGLLTYAALIAGGIQALRLVFKQFHSIAAHTEAAAIGGALASYLVGIQFGFGSLAVEAVIWLLLGCLAAMVSTRHGFPIRRRLGAGIAAIWALATLWTLAWLIADMYFQRGETFWHQGEPLLAMEEYSKATFWNPAQDLYWVRRGQSMEALGFSPIEDYRHAVDANPMNAANHAFAAWAFALNGDAEASTDAWANAQFYDPQRRSEYPEGIK
jgi:putative inorganic carbon (hco3(-)) transporter